MSVLSLENEAMNPLQLNGTESQNR